MVKRFKNATVVYYSAYKFFSTDLPKLETAISLLEEKRRKKFKAIYAIPRGGLVIGVALSHALKLNLLLTKEELKQCAIDEVLVVDDIADHGRALKAFRDAGYCTLTLAKKPRSAVTPTIYLHEVKNNDWISHFWGDGDGYRIEE